MGFIASMLKIELQDFRLFEFRILVGIYFIMRALSSQLHTRAVMRGTKDAYLYGNEDDVKNRVNKRWEAMCRSA